MPCSGSERFFPRTISAEEAGVSEEWLQQLRELEYDVLEAGCQIHFYWANFGPLSRGSAAIGFAALTAVAFAAYVEVRYRTDLHLSQALT